MRVHSVILAALVAALAAFALAGPPTPAPVKPAATKPDVRITMPRGGYSTDRIATVTGTVSDREIQLADLTVNGTTFATRVTAGQFSQSLLAPPGSNTVTVAARNRWGVGTDTVTFFSNAPKVDLQVFLVFDPQPFYIDLWVTEPDGEKVYWNNRESKDGGKLHDLFNRAEGGGVGLGPQAFTKANAEAGLYKIQVNYWAGGDSGVATQQGPYGPDKRLPIVPVRIEVVAFEGTDFEFRRTFEAPLTKPGDTFDVGEVTIEPPHDREGPLRFQAREAMKKNPL